MTLDLVCGPDGPVPDSRQRYRLLEHLGAGGQAEVYQGVRLSGGVSSAPVSVKVFRRDPNHPLAEQLVAWDKGDAVLMDLNSRGVPGICQRIDGFSGPLPQRPNTKTNPEAESVPYQILAYISGKTLIDQMRDDYLASQGSPSSLNAVGILQGLAETLRQLHRPSSGATPVIHMDVKPANLLISPEGHARLIDFTASRYYDSAHLTTVAYSPSSGGPEAHQGASSVGFAYDVHGFGAVAYYLVTGRHPRQPRTGPLPPKSEGSLVATEIRGHPVLELSPSLAKHLLAPLADRPESRPRTDELAAWVERLAELVRALPAAARLVDWSASDRQTAQRSPVTSRPPSRTLLAPASPAVAGQSSQPALVSTSVMPVLRPDIFSGSAKVPTEPDRYEQLSATALHRNLPPESPAQYPPFHGDFSPPPLPKSRAKGYTVLASIWFVVCWFIWLFTVIFNRYSLTDPVWGLVVAAGAAVGVWWLSRLGGHLLRTTFEQGHRRSTLVQNLATGTFVALCGAAFLSRTPLALDGLIAGVQELTQSLQ